MTKYKQFPRHLAGELANRMYDQASSFLRNRGTKKFHTDISGDLFRQLNKLSMTDVKKNLWISIK